MKLVFPAVKIFMKMFLLLLFCLPVTNLTVDYLVLLISKIFATGQKVTIESYMKGVFTMSE